MLLTPHKLSLRSSATKMCNFSGPQYEMYKRNQNVICHKFNHEKIAVVGDHTDSFNPDL